MNDRVKEIEERLAKVSPGPWFGAVSQHKDAKAEHEGECGVFPENERERMGKPGVWSICHCGPEHDAQSRADAIFIAHTPTDIRWLLAELKKRDESLRIARIQGRNALIYYDEQQVEEIHARADALGMESLTEDEQLLVLYGRPAQENL